MDFTVLITGLLIGVGIPLRNKAIKEYRKKGTLIHGRIYLESK